MKKTVLMVSVFLAVVAAVGYVVANATPAITAWWAALTPWEHTQVIAFAMVIYCVTQLIEALKVKK